jgi:hypothetical protein
VNRAKYLLPTAVLGFRFLCLFPPVHLLLCAKHLLVAATAQLDSFSSEILNGTWLHFGVSRKRGLSQYIRWFFV